MPSSDATPPPVVLPQSGNLGLSGRGVAFGDTTGGGATRYARIRYRLILVDVVGWLGFLWAYQRLGISATTAQWVSTNTFAEPVPILGYLVIFGVISYLVFLPLHVYRGFVLEHQFGLSRLTLAGWLWREAKHVLVSALIGLALIEGLYALLRHAPTTWTVFATIGWVGVSIVLARVFPTWLLPIFYKTSPLVDASLTQRLLTLCQRAHLPVLGVFRVSLSKETRKANAALAGLGRTRRVLLSDTLLEHFSPEEIETVLGHELGHQRHHHIGKLLMLSGVGSFIAFSVVEASSRLWIESLDLQGLADLAGFPTVMLALSLIGLIGLPLQNAISRHFEWQADRFAVTVTTRPRSFAAALRKLGELNLADPKPPRWVEVLFYDHPPITKRINFAEQNVESLT